jgi:acetolactate synthase-1/2/3 large subunit
LVGSGIRTSGTEGILEKILSKLQIPCALAWAMEALPHDHPSFAGRQGTIGDRAGNFTIQNADLVLILGSRLCIRQISYNGKSFAHRARKIQVDIDPAEMEKPFVKIDEKIRADLGRFMPEFLQALENYSPPPSHGKWMSWCKVRVEKYPVVDSTKRTVTTEGRINPYYFLETLSRHSRNDDAYVCGDGAACVMTFQSTFFKKGQRLFSNSGAASMGYDLPASIGAAIGAKRMGSTGRIFCMAGDGSLMMNLQELQTLKTYGFPVVVWVINNDGYLSIRSTQNAFFKRKAGSDSSSGLGFPNYAELAHAFGMPGTRLEGKDFEAQLKSLLTHPGPQLIEVLVDPEQGFEPKLSSRRLDDGTMVTSPLEDMAPFLSREELAENIWEDRK